jgi:hypothetical protein
VPLKKTEEGIQREGKVPKPVARDEEDDREQDEEDKQPRRRKKKKKKSGSGNSTMLLVLGIVAGSLFIVIVGVGSIAVYLYTRVAPVVQEVQRIARQPAGRQNAENANFVARGKIIFERRASLTRADPPDPTPELAEVGARMKVHQVAMQPGKTYVIMMDSNAFDPYLRIETPGGRMVAEDDDSGGDLNARIVFRPQEAGQFRVIATSWDGEVGPFHLRVQEAE